MSVETIERDFKQKVCDQLRIASEGVDRYRVFTPFLFEDGDHLAPSERGIHAMENRVLADRRVVTGVCRDPHLESRRVDQPGERVHTGNMSQRDGFGDQEDA